MQTTIELNIAGLVGAVAGPLVILLALWWFRDPVSAFLRELPRRLKALSVAGVTLELADATQASLSALHVTVDLRRAGSPNDVNDSTLASFYKQIEDPTPIDYAVVDLGEGAQWLTSRLYVLSIILQRMRGLSAFVFVETSVATRQRFLGVCSASSVRWRLAARWPRFESAMAAAELNLWGLPYDDVQGPVPIPRTLPGSSQVTMSPFHVQANIVNDWGRLVAFLAQPPEAAAILLRSFIDGIQRAGAPPSAEWQDLGQGLGPSEYAVWVTGQLIDSALRDSLDKRSVRLSDLQGWSQEVRVRAVVEHGGDWVAVIRDDSIFDRLINRRIFLEQAGQRIIESP